MATAYYTSQINLDKKEIGEKTESTARVFYTGQIEADKRGSLRMNSSVDWEPCTNPMDQDKRATGDTARGMDMVLNKAQMGRVSLSFGRVVFFLNDV